MNSESRSTRQVSRRSTASACSRISLPSSKPVERRIPTCSAIVRSSSGSGSTTRGASARSATQPATTRVSARAAGSCAASIAPRTRVISCTRSKRPSCRFANSRSAGCTSPKCGQLHATAACRSPASGTRPASVSSASVPSATSSEPGCRRVPAQSRRWMARSSASTGDSSAIRSASAAASESAACQAPAKHRGSSPARTCHGTSWLSFKEATIPCCIAPAFARRCPAGFRARHRLHRSSARRRCAIGSRMLVAASSLQLTQ